MIVLMEKLNRKNISMKITHLKYFISNKFGVKVVCLPPLINSVKKL